MAVPGIRLGTAHGLRQPVRRNFMFLPRLLRPFRLLGFAFMAYRYWRRLSPQHRADLKESVRVLAMRMR